MHLYPSNSSGRIANKFYIIKENEKILKNVIYNLFFNFLIKSYL